MSQSTNFTITVPAGTYWLGDPCYAVPDADWMPLLNSCDFFNHPKGTVRGHHVYASGTRWGDGQYRGTDGHSYPVDAGLIGLVPEALVTEAPGSESRKLTIDHDFIFGYEDGTILIDDIKIFTGDDPEEDSDDDYEEGNYESDEE